jgi:hypothetical protein
VEQGTAATTEEGRNEVTHLSLVGLDEGLLEWSTRPPRLTASMAGASYVRIELEAGDTITSHLVDAGSTAGVTWDGRRFALAGIRTMGGRVCVVFEDSLIAALRARRAPLMVPAGSTTRSELVARLATEAGVAYVADPDPALIPTVVRRSDSWSTLAGLGWRCYSDGDQVIVGSEEWLTARTPTVDATEGADGVRDIGLSLWTNKPASEAWLTVDADWPAWPGTPVRLIDVDPAHTWLITGRVTDADAETAVVTLTRGPWLPEGAPAWT